MKISNWPAGLTFFIQEMLKKNILASDKCYANFKHDEKSLRIYKKACIQVFKKIAYLDKNKSLVKKLEGPIKQIGFKRLTN